MAKRPAPAPTRGIHPTSNRTGTNMKALRTWLCTDVRVSKWAVTLCVLIALFPILDNGHYGAASWFGALIGCLIYDFIRWRRAMRDIASMVHTPERNE